MIRDKNGVSYKCLGKNFIPGSQSFADGFLGPKGNVGFTMKFSMKKAKKIINSYNKNTINKVTAGLNGDYSENSCTIYDEHGYHNYDVYDHTVWAKPIIIIEFNDKPSEAYESWEKMK